MMKYQVLFAVWALLAAHVSCAAVQPVELPYSDGIESANNVQILDHYEEVILRNGFSKLSETHWRLAVSNAIIIRIVKYIGGENTTISSYRWKELTDDGASVRVVNGGVGTNTLTLEIRSAIGGGFHVQIEVFG